MVWNEQGSKKRVQGNDFHDFEVDVQDLRRAMDFRNLGTKDVRRAAAVHLYVDVPNFHRAVDDAGNNKQKQRKLVRSASVLRKVQGDLLTEDEIGDIQRQTVRCMPLPTSPTTRTTRAMRPTGLRRRLFTPSPITPLSSTCSTVSSRMFETSAVP